jgi:TonB family protein
VPLATVRGQSEAAQGPPADLEATIRVANAQKNHEVLERAAGDYEKLQRLPAAQKLREAALLIRQDSGDRSPKYAEGLVKLGDLMSRRSFFPEAMALYAQAVAIGDMPETVPALIHLGIYSAFHKRDAPAAKDYLQRARNAAETGNDMGRAMTWLAFLDQGDAANAGQVESLYRSAISIEDIDSADQAMSIEMLARFLRSQDRADEAGPLEERARNARKSLAAAFSTPREAAVSSAVKVRDGVTKPALIGKIEPEYSEAARVLKHQGTVRLNITVDVDGRAKDIQVVQGLGLGLDEKAVEAVTQWQFRPGESNGAPLPVLAQVEINFRLL